MGTKVKFRKLTFIAALLATFAARLSVHGGQICSVPQQRLLIINRLQLLACAKRNLLYNIRTYDG